MLCEWTVMLTDLIDADRFTAEELWILYRVRWQVELLFKRWKGGSGLGKSRGRRGPRMLCELLAKLHRGLDQALGDVVARWPAVRRQPDAGRVASEVVGRSSGGGVGSGVQGAVERVLERLKADLDRLPKRPKRKRKTTRQTLFAPSFS